MEKKIALALGGGGVRGSAHIGVLRLLDREGVQVAGLAGTSIGGMVGALYLCGQGPEAMQEVAAAFNRRKLFRRGRGEPKNSMLGLGGLTEILQRLLGDKKFEDLPVPFAVTATDLNTGAEIVLDKGRLLDAVLATIAFPGIFPTHTIDGIQLVDGAVTNPLPVKLARSLAPGLPVVAVALSGKPSAVRAVSSANDYAGLSIFKRLGRLRWIEAFRVFNRSASLTRRRLGQIRLEIEKPDLVVYPDVSSVGIIDGGDVHELAHEGEVAMQEKLPELQKLFMNLVLA